MKREKVDRFILRLIKPTASAELIWHPIAPRNPELPTGDIILGKVYHATISNRRFSLFRYSHKPAIDIPFTVEAISLEMKDGEGNTDYIFEYTNSMNDLYSLVVEQCSNINSILDEILLEEIELMEAYYYTNTKKIEITQALNAKLINGKLNIVASNEIAGDPDPGIRKNLKIIYQFSGIVIERDYVEGDLITLP